MISIEIDEKIIKQHALYIVNDSGIKKRITDHLKNNKNKSIFEKEERAFLLYIQDEIDQLNSIEKNKNIITNNIFLARPSKLYEIIQGIRINYQEVQKRIDDNKNYKDDLLKVFGYESFSSRPLKEYYYKEVEVLKKYISELPKTKVRGISNKEKIFIDIIKGMANECDQHMIEQIIAKIEDINYENKNQYISELRKICTSEIERIEKPHELIDKWTSMSIDTYKAKKGKWSAYDFVFSLELKVCPYCNINYIYPLYGENGKTRADLDHYYSKSNYPYLSMSIYNLIPSCKICNSSYKNAKEFGDNNISVYEENIEKCYRMTYYPRSVASFWGDDDVAIEFEKNGDDNTFEKLENNIRDLDLKNRYQYHTNEVKKLLKKSAIFDEQTLNSIYQEHSNIFETYDEVVQCVYGSVEDVANESLGKMRRDILEELRGYENF